MDLAEYGAVAAYWEGQIDTGELCQILKPLTPDLDSRTGFRH
jgi:hypothetical protein